MVWNQTSDAQEEVNINAAINGTAVDPVQSLEKNS